MNYLISWYGQQICVGLLNKEGAEEEANLAHNLFKSHNNTYLFHGALNFKSTKEFWRFLILKEYLPKLMDNLGCSRRKRKELLQDSFVKVREVKENNVNFQNFMQQVSQSNNCYDIGVIPNTWDETSSGEPA
jgi:hypothetical protein